MPLRFPLRLLHLLVCARDEGSLAPVRGAVADVIDSGSVRCRTCGREYLVRNGILCLLAEQTLHQESAFEMRRRDEKAAQVAVKGEWASRFSEASEITPTLEALEPYDGAIVAEHGSGTGRYTMRLAARVGGVVAVDFSFMSLEVLGRRLDERLPVALVQADATRPHLASRRFDRVLSTLHSNLPSPTHRIAALRHSARALRDGGRAVISMHHYGLRELLRMQPRAGRYADSGIHRYFMRAREAKEEASCVFREVRLTHVSASVPGVPSTVVASIAGAVPIVRSALGRILLASCEQPL